MYSSTSAPSVVLNLIHKTRFSFPGEQLWFGRAYLFEDRVELKGWQWTGRYKRSMPLDEIDHVEWWTQGEGTNFAFFLSDGSTVALKLKQAAGTWKFEIDSLIGSSSFQDAALPDEAPQKDAAA